MLSSTQIEHISSVSSNKKLPISMLEKDIHITDILNDLLTSSFPGVTLYFCGGASLSKAYELIERINEDIYLMVTFDPTHTSYESRRLRLIKLQDEISVRLETMNFKLETSVVHADQKILTASSIWSYDPMFDYEETLQPRLKIEIAARPPLLETRLITLDYLYNRFVENHPRSTKVVRCISASETLAERVITFLRRYAQLKNDQVSLAWDETNVRYLYDVCTLYKKQPSILDEAKNVIRLLLILDEATQGSRFPLFKNNATKAFRDTINILRRDKLIAQQYESKLMTRTFGDTKPKFNECFTTFDDVSNELIAHLDTEKINLSIHRDSLD